MPAIGYSPARWRFARFEEINRTVLWVSHIVIMHKRSSPGEPSLRPMEWRPDGPMPDRTEGEALSRALKVAELAAKNPEDFAQLARTYSDDVITRDAGGSLGGVRAGQLPAEYRDALAVMKSGETSRVVQTALGYSVLVRRSAPSDERVAGRRIVVRYRGTVGGPHGSPSSRSREAALDRARNAAQRATSGSTAFDALVAEYSESADAAQSGDMGVWSLRDPGFLPREVERLGQLRVGDVSAPVESIFGFEVLLRTEADERQRYAMSAVQIQYDPSLPDEQEHSRAGALRLANELARQLRLDPSQFDRLRKRYCCDEAEQWTAGRGPVGVDPVLERLTFGQIADKPVEANWSYIVPKRIDPSTLPEPPPPNYELPTPKGPDLETIVRNADGKLMALYTRNFSGELDKLLPLPKARIDEVRRRLDLLAASFESPGEEGLARTQSLHATLSELQTQLGPKDYAVFDAALWGYCTRMVLGPLHMATSPSASPLARISPPSRRP
jgi:hypothetical protein